MSIYMFWPIILAVLSDIFYQICAKSTPESLNPFASLIITYLVGAAVSVAVYFMTSEGQSLIAEWKGINWTTFVWALLLLD